MSENIHPDDKAPERSLEEKRESNIDAPDIKEVQNSDRQSLELAHATNDNQWKSEEGLFAITENGETIAKQSTDGDRESATKSYHFLQAAEAQTPAKRTDAFVEAHEPGTFDVPGRGKVTKLKDGRVLDWPKPGVTYRLGSETFKSEWQPGKPLPTSDEAVGTVINWVNTFSAANPGMLDHATGNALRHVLCPAMLMNQYKLGGCFTAYALDCANVGFETWSAIEAAWPALTTGNLEAANKIIDWDDTKNDLDNATAGVNIGISNLFSSSEEVAGKSIEAAFEAGKNNGKVPNIQRWF